MKTLEKVAALREILKEKAQNKELTGAMEILEICKSIESDLESIKFHLEKQALKL